MAYRTLDDHAKRRLTSPEDIQKAVAILKSQGYDETSTLVELLKMFYLDLDQYSDIVRAA